MDYPRRARKSKRGRPGGGGAENRDELRLAEFSAPRGEERPWRVAESDEPAHAFGWSEWRRERGRLH